MQWTGAVVVGLVLGLCVPVAAAAASTKGMPFGTSVVKASVSLATAGAAARARARPASAAALSSGGSLSAFPRCLRRHRRASSSLRFRPTSVATSAATTTTTTVAAAFCVAPARARTPRDEVVGFDGGGHRSGRGVDHLRFLSDGTARGSSGASATGKKRTLTMMAAAGSGADAEEAGSSLSSSSSSSTTETQSSYPSLRGKNLVSVEDCLEAWERSKGGGVDRGEDDGDDKDDGSKGRSRGLAFVDGTWYHRGGRNGRAEFEAGPRIPNSVHVDMDDIAAKGHLNPKNLPHMLPPKELFAAAMDSFGISNDDHVVVYGRDGCIFTPRTFFLFRSMGHEPSRVHLMQGSFEEWAERGGDVETGPVTVLRSEDLDPDGSPPRYRARDAANVCDMDYVLRVVETAAAKDGEDDHDNAAAASPVLLDPRGTTFHKGHIPGAINIPYLSVLEEDDRLKFRPRDELRRVFEEAGVDVDTDRQIVCTCGSGVSVCHLFLALEECGRDNGKDRTVIYDGSWTEWGADENTPKVIGEE